MFSGPVVCCCVEASAGAPVSSGSDLDAALLDDEKPADLVHLRGFHAIGPSEWSWSRSFSLSDTVAAVVVVAALPPVAGPSVTGATGLSSWCSFKVGR